ncbi:ketoacyl-ACP synthase III [Paenibacillus guangzhouensis]|uniref:ketoacyl-ACP synthase III n=1 Tax=Paenibacillus guangzhouensis TaxID=1473112 RepID=UPI001266B28F|nr:ketoacyl-ACP synthase III [Paenibacillus guangzhouensis]
MTASNVLNDSHIELTSHARITAIGAYVPERQITNADMERMVDTSDEWIVQRTGIRERRAVSEGEFTSDMCIRAVEDMLANYPVDVADVDMILVATNTPDVPFPSVAAIIQARFGIESTGSLDINATCAGFAYGLHLANGLISAGLHRKILVFGADALTRVTDYTDRTTCILFGDGAGVVMVEQDMGNGAFQAVTMGTDGTGGKHVYRSGTRTELHGTELVGDGKIVQNGREVYRFAVSTVPKGIAALLEQTGGTTDQIDWFVPHSANLRIIESICEKTGIPIEKALYSLEYYGNTSAASIPLAIHLGVQQGIVKPGDNMLLFGFGGGLTYTGLMLRWM